MIIKNLIKIYKGILFKDEERLNRKLTWWEIMETKWYEWVDGKNVVWDLRERIDELCDDSTIVFYLSDLTLDELREFKDYIIWNENFWNRVKHREDLKEEFKREFEECEEKFYDWDSDERWPEDQDMYGNKI